MAHYAKPAENPDPKSLYAFILRAFELIERVDEEGGTDERLSHPKALANVQRLRLAEAEDERYIRAELGRARLEQLGLTSILAGAPQPATDQLSQVMGDHTLSALRTQRPDGRPFRCGDFLPRLSARVLTALELFAAGSELRTLIVAMNSTDPAAGRLLMAKLQATASAQSVVGGSAGLGGDLTYSTFRSARMTIRRFKGNSQTKALQFALSRIRDVTRLRAILSLFAGAATEANLRMLAGSRLADAMHDQFYLPWLVRSAIDRQDAHAQTDAPRAA